jgi:excisionase family DNA binding protein
MLTATEAAERVGRNPETVRRWIRSGRLRARRIGTRHVIDTRDLRPIEDQLYPMSELPPEWQIGDDGSPVTQDAVALVTGLFAILGERRAAPPDELRDFALQCVWCMFAEDLGQLEAHLFTHILDELYPNGTSDSVSSRTRKAIGCVRCA